MKKKEIPTLKTDFNTLNKFGDDLIKLQKDSGLLDQHITIIRPNKLKEKERFVKVFQLALGYFVKTLSPSGCKLFMYFIYESEFNNIVEVDQIKIQETLQIGRTAVNKGLKELQEINIIKIIQDTNDKRRNTYVINHHVMWKGNPGDRIKSIKNKKQYFINPNQLSLQLKDKE
jgi:hypothetical protein